MRRPKGTARGGGARAVRLRCAACRHAIMQRTPQKGSDTMKCHSDGEHDHDHDEAAKIKVAHDSRRATSLLRNTCGTLNSAMAASRAVRSSGASTAPKYFCMVAVMKLMCQRCSGLDSGFLRDTMD